MHVSLYSWLQDHSVLLRDMLRGIEKESLRVSSHGQLSMRPHPQALGSALTHPFITTDYSEALLELITPASSSVATALHDLEQLHRHVLACLPDEMLWAHSMPCFLGEDDAVPLAQYGSSATGQMKTVYRHGLGLRYTRRMQTIAGIHYNLSFPDSFFSALQEVENPGSDLELRTFKDQRYLGLLRNFMRYSWLLLYLFGSSPAVCRSFMRDRPHHMQSHQQHTLIQPWATSLRMSDIGYQNHLQAELDIDFNTLSSYLQGLDKAIRTPDPGFAKLGVRSSNGQWLQLNDHILQIENEFYGLIRPKQPPKADERPGLALKRRGISYIEMRCVDLNPESAIGIQEQDAYFLEIFALYCLLEQSADFDRNEPLHISRNQQQTAEQGRNEDLRLEPVGLFSRPFSLQSGALTLLAGMQPVAVALDRAYDTTFYTQALSTAYQRIDQPEQSNSARIIQQLEKQSCSFFDLALQQTLRNDERLRHPVDPEWSTQLEQLRIQSVEDQQRLEEKQKDLSLEQYLLRYFQPVD